MKKLTRAQQSMLRWDAPPMILRHHRALRRAHRAPHRPQLDLAAIAFAAAAWIFALAAMGVGQ